ncbi:hypothetical protein AB0M43_00010 [Longispora sp. NPDC051575]|uniref:hypothetical protein n=1 Tax=Longispora sp. NPDC051575 TaxID=3154943 RepID=UPI00343C3FBE
MAGTDDSDPVKAAKAATAANVALVEAATRTQSRIRDLQSQLAAAQTDYVETHKAVTAAWGKSQTETFGLMAPDQLRTKQNSPRSSAHASDTRRNGTSGEDRPR